MERNRTLRVIRAPKCYRTAWISDVHLGTRTANAAALLEFFRANDFETLYIVGDLIDVWSLRRGFYWPQEHNDVIQKILRKARKGTRVVYIPGNHDDFVARFLGTFGNISIQKHALHVTADGRRILVMHGHELDAVVQNGWIARLGDAAYEFLLSLNPAINWFRRQFGRGYWSLSAYAKQRVKDAGKIIREYENAVARYAADYGADGVLCGHIHSASIQAIGSLAYYNCGDWVESCSALVEHNDGRIELLRCNAFATGEDAFARELEAIGI